MKDAIILASVSGTFLWILRELNPTYDPDRYYYQNARIKYYLMKLCTLILIFACVLNLKFVVFTGLQLILRHKLQR